VCYCVIADRICEEAELRRYDHPPGRVGPGAQRDPGSEPEEVGHDDLTVSIGVGNGRLGAVRIQGRVVYVVRPPRGRI